MIKLKINCDTVKTAENVKSEQGEIRMHQHPQQSGPTGRRRKIYGNYKQKTLHRPVVGISKGRLLEKEEAVPRARQKAPEWTARSNGWKCWHLHCASCSDLNLSAGFTVSVYFKFLHFYLVIFQWVQTVFGYVHWPHTIVRSGICLSVW